MRRTLGLGYWLMPGIRIKRWLILFSLGMFVSSLGIAVMFNAGQIISAYAFLWSAVYTTTGQFLPAPLAGVALAIVGFVAMAFAVQRLMKAVLGVLLPPRNNRLGSLLYQQRQLERGPRVTALGGGTGLSTLLRGIKQYTANVTAVVTVTDDGGSSGRLRGELGILPPGDIRNCLVALAHTEPLMEQLFQHRFERGSLKGHSFGNLLISAMTDMLGDFEKAVEEASKVLAIQGKVLPSTLTNVELCAVMADGETVCGESKIAADRRPIRSVSLQPAEVRALPGVCEAIEQADLIVIGPGSLYTSVMPNLLIPDIREALRRTRAPKVYVVNIMTQPGETESYSASDHVRAIEEHVGGKIFDAVVINTEKVKDDLLAQYREDGAEQVKNDRITLERMGYQVLHGEFVDHTVRDTVARHDPNQLASLLMNWLVRRGSKLDLGWGLHFLLTHEANRRHQRRPFAEKKTTGRTSR